MPCDFSVTLFSVHKLRNATEKVVFRTNVSIQNSIHIWAYLIVLVCLLLEVLSCGTSKNFFFVLKKIFAYEETTENYLLFYRSSVPFRPNFVIFVVDRVDIRVIGDIIVQESTHWYCFWDILVAYLCSLHLWCRQWRHDTALLQRSL